MIKIFRTLHSSVCYVPADSVNEVYGNRYFIGTGAVVMVGEYKGIPSVFVSGADSRLGVSVVKPLMEDAQSDGAKIDYALLVVPKMSFLMDCDVLAAMIGKKVAKGWRVYSKMPKEYFNMSSNSLIDDVVNDIVKHSNTMGVGIFKDKVDNTEDKNIPKNVNNVNNIDKESFDKSNVYNNMNKKNVNQDMAQYIAELLVEAILGPGVKVKSANSANKQTDDENDDVKHVGEFLNVVGKSIDDVEDEDTSDIEATDESVGNADKMIDEIPDEDDVKEAMDSVDEVTDEDEQSEDCCESEVCECYTHGYDVGYARGFEQAQFEAEYAIKEAEKAAYIKGFNKAIELVQQAMANPAFQNGNKCRLSATDSDMNLRVTRFITLGKK